MASSLRKCKFCNESFDITRTPYEKIKTRYAHLDCQARKDHERKAEQRKQVTDLIKELYAPYDPDWALIGSQISNYEDRGYTIMGIYYTLYYYFVIKGNNIRDREGVGIIPYVYKKAQQYYANLNSAHTQVERLKNQDIKVEQTENIVTIVKKEHKKALLDFDY